MDGCYKRHNLRDIDIKKTSDDEYTIQLRSQSGELFSSAIYVVNDKYPVIDLKADVAIDWSAYNLSETPYKSHELFHGKAFHLLDSVYVGSGGCRQAQFS